MAVELDISLVRAFITKNFEPQGMFVLDMIYIADVPHAVFEWRQREDGQHIPMVFVPLEEQFLEKMPEGSEFDFMYRQSIEDPRRDAPAQ